MVELQPLNMLQLQYMQEPTHFFPQFLENSRSHSNAYNLVPRKNTHQLNGKGTGDSTENVPGITDGHQSYEKCECKDQCVKKEPESEK